jgi:hypothetical protein
VSTVNRVLHGKSGLDYAEALRCWRETHGPMVAEVRGVQRDVQLHAMAAPDGVPAFQFSFNAAVAAGRDRPATAAVRLPFLIPARMQGCLDR